MPAADQRPDHNTPKAVRPISWRLFAWIVFLIFLMVLLALGGPAVRTSLSADPAGSDARSPITQSPAEPATPT